jgi:hypothetical protein
MRKRAVNSDKESGLWAKVLYLVFCSGSSGGVLNPDILIRTEVLTAEKQNNFQEKNLNYD